MGMLIILVTLAYLLSAKNPPFESFMKDHPILFWIGFVLFCLAVGQI